MLHANENAGESVFEFLDCRFLQYRESDPKIATPFRMIIIVKSARFMSEKCTVRKSFLHNQVVTIKKK